MKNNIAINLMCIEFYPCKPDIFEQTYEKMTDENIPGEITISRMDYTGALTSYNYNCEKCGYKFIRVDSKICPMCGVDINWVP